FIGVDMDDQRYEYNGGDIKVRLMDDDGYVHYHALVDDDDFSCELLLSWGGSYSGAIALEMHIDDYQKFFGKPKHERFISKCGKWYSYMG
ncbi:hypothetical protein OSK38_28020, partial [Escherichia coli]|nr:hypothetical protein [Escherichia coli]